MTNNPSKKKTIKFLFEESDSEISNKITLTSKKLKKDENNLIKCFLRIKPTDINDINGKKLKNNFQLKKFF
jgi:hypothetical protein